MPNNDVQMRLNVPVGTWRCLVAMATEDVREEENFVIWLIWREAQRRGFNGNQELEEERHNAGLGEK